MQISNVIPKMFAPAKLALFAYLFLVWRGKIDAGPFWIVASLFLVVEIVHNDWLRILLNKHAEGSGGQGGHRRSRESGGIDDTPLADQRNGAWCRVLPPFGGSGQTLSDTRERELRS